MLSINKLCIFIVMLFVLLSTTQCRVVKNDFFLDATKEFSIEEITNYGEGKQLFFPGQGKETNTPDFVRLVIMRLIYGIASTMGLEDRLEGAFNGIFLPPNADSDLFGNFNFSSENDIDLDGVFE